MPGDEIFQVEGQVKGPLANGTYLVELANGHQLTGFVTGQAKHSFTALKAGGKVKLQLTPYDLSAGRILVETKTI